MTEELLRILSKKNYIVTAETESGKRKKFFSVFECILQDDMYYMLLLEVSVSGQVSKNDVRAYRYTRVNKQKVLVPLSDCEAEKVFEVYRGERAEAVELLDENGKKLNRLHIRTKGNPTPDNTYFAVVEIWVKSKGKLLLVQRHPDKDYALQWECPGGTVRAGETYEQAAVRELYEETSIFVFENELKFLGANRRNNWICYSYMLCLDCELRDVQLQTEECAACRLADARNTDGFVGDLTPWHAETFNKYKNAISA